VDIRLGTLRFFDGLPDDETVDPVTLGFHASIEIQN
jgi:hypothetical protein